jgi:hypothetical protein
MEGVPNDLDREKPSEGHYKKYDGNESFFHLASSDGTIPHTVGFMKYWKILLQTKFVKALGERGQSILEFVLLLLVITGVSYGFVLILNKNIARYWEYSANLILNDRAGGTKHVRLD